MQRNRLPQIPEEAWQTTIKEMWFDPNTSATQILVYIEQQFKVRITRQTLSNRASAYKWGKRPRRGKVVNGDTLRDRVAPKTDVPPAQQLKRDETFIKRRCEKGHTWGGPAYIVLHQACPLCFKEGR